MRRHCVPGGPGQPRTSSAKRPTPPTRTSPRSAVHPVHQSARSAAFPAEAPPSLTDPHVIAEHEWAAFAALPDMGNHWLRPGWGPDTRRYYWFLTVGHAPQIAELAKQCQKPLAGDGFDTVPPEGLHVTICRIGDARDVTEQTLEDLVEAAEFRCGNLPGFDLRAIPVAGSRGAVRLSLAPWEPLLALHRAVGTAGLDVGLGRRQPTEDFRPHLGVAYCNQDTDAVLIRDKIEKLRALQSQQFNVREVQLVELRRERRVYRWDVKHSIPLHSVKTGLSEST